MNKKKISVIIPCYYSEKTISDVVIQTAAEFDRTKRFDYEFILVNDGSKDNTYNVIKRLAREYSYVTGIDLAKNCGQHNAILAAMTYAKGDYILGMDDDFQTHPSQIYKLIDKLEEGYDMVYGRFPQRHHSLIRNIESKLHNMTVRYLINKPKDLKACPMYIIRRFIRDEIIKSESTYTNLQGLFLRTTASVANADIEHFDRRFGKSGYNFKKLIKLWSAFLNYSEKPVRLVGKTGILITAVSIIMLLWGAISGKENLFLSSVVIFCTGLVIMALGIIGEYIVRMFMIITHEPQYVIRTDTSKMNEVGKIEKEITYSGRR